ncbi:hypothetical protein ACSBQS_05450 [Serratia sp. H402Y]|uniref:hypothetical protein n=1 Tax=Serratia sp. H402Y TaxID=3444320 RepID=UPI003EB892BA
MRNISVKNGFEYYCEKHNFGVWVHYWYYRPQGKDEWINFYLPVTLGRAKKQDLLDFLDNPAEALKKYDERIAYLSDVEEARREIERCKATLDRVTHPDWGGRGNNPDKDARRIRDARSAYSSAEDRLEYAIKLKERLSKSV